MSDTSNGKRAKEIAQAIARDYFRDLDSPTAGTVLGQLVAVFVASVSDNDDEAERALAIHIHAVRELVPVVRVAFKRDIQ